MLLGASISFFVIGLLSYLLGLNGVSGISIEMGKLLLLIFVVIAVLGFVTSVITGKKTKLSN
jgi:uncharacterized membrane protein YtjA (UPF0391 family)